MKYKKPIFRITLVLLIALSQTVSARMYQWVETDTGTTQFSGKPPVWYRADSSSGPRVFVFENGRLIDDSGIDVDENVRQQLRRKAFALVEEDQQKAKDKLAKSLELKEKFAEDKPKKPELEDFDEAPQQESSDEELLVDEDFIEDQEKDISTENKVEELRKLIAEWESAQNESARKAIEQ